MLEGARGLAFVPEVNILGLGFAAVGLLAAAVVVLPFALGAAAWEAVDRTSFKRWGPVVGMILAVLALLFSRPRVRWPITVHCRYQPNGW